MSCYVVDHEHISALLEYAASRRITVYHEALEAVFGEPRAEINSATFDTWGQILLDENVRSVEARYPDCKESRDYPGPVDLELVYKHEMYWCPLAPVQMLKAARCYAYQACESDDWKQSVSFKLIESIKARSIEELPGYDDAEWGVPERPVTEDA